MIFARKALPLALLFAAEASEAFSLNLQFPFFNFDWNPPTPHVPQYKTPRIAIIGAGAGGSSAAFWISKAQERFGLDVEVDVYERANYIGGREYTFYLG
jgi:prenylcysteine oxidase / farnesylcysteine lyase